LRALRALYEESLVIKQELGDHGSISSALCNLGDVACAQGDYERAWTLYEESVALCQQMGDKRGSAEGLEGLAAAAGAMERHRQAVLLWRVAATIREAIVAPLPPNDQVEQDAQVSILKETLGAEGFAAAWVVAEGLSLEETISKAIEPRRSA